MPSTSTIYYKTFPLSKHGAMSSPSSVAVTVPLGGSSSTNAGGKRNAIQIMEPISLGRPAKLQKQKRLQDEETEPWICPSSIKTNRSGKDNNSIQKIIQPIVNDIKPGCQRSDNKDPINLAVSVTTLHYTEHVILRSFFSCD